MQNMKVASILNRIADYLELDGIDFRTKAYRRAAHTVENLSVDIKDIRDQEKLEELPGIGKHIEEKIVEILDTGKLKYLEKLIQEYPVNFDELMSVEGLGPRKIKLLYNELGIKDLDGLEREAKRHHIRRLKGMGVKTEAKLLHNIEFARKSSQRRLLGEVLPLAREIKVRIKSLDYVDNVEIAGSLRRMKETVGDIDILTVSQHPEEVMDYFINLDLVDEVIVKGHLKSTVRLYNGMDADIRVFKKEDFGSALVYFTGSRELNIGLRKIAIVRQMKLNEYGVFQGDERLAGANETEVFNSLGLDYIPPELRENTGEIEAAQNGSLPELVDYSDITGDLHTHTSWSDGKSSIMEMAWEGTIKGYEYLAVTDHTNLPVANGMDEFRLLSQMVKIDEINDEFDNITILKGAEVNLDSYGNLDISSDILESLDVVIAAIHVDLRQDSEQMNMRILKALENEHVDILAHPTGRKLNEREAYKLDLEKLFQNASDTGTILEVNSQPKRLDLKDIHVKMAIEYGCKLAINTDAHNQKDLSLMKLGIATARRGWAEKKNIVNTQSLKGLLKSLK